MIFDVGVVKIFFKKLVIWRGSCGCCFFIIIVIRGSIVVSFILKRNI